MINQPLSTQTLKRLLYTKKLLLVAEEHKQSGTELDRVFSILLCDNAIEMLLKTIATEKGIRLRGEEGFWSLWKTINKKITSELPLRLEIDHLRQERNFVQHRGAIPSKPNVDRHLNYARSLIEQVLPQHFGKTFDEIYLSDLIEAQEFRDKIREIEQLLEAGNFDEIPKRSSEVFALMLVKSEVFKYLEEWVLLDLEDMPELEEVAAEQVVEAFDFTLNYMFRFASDVIEQFKILSIVHDYAKYSRFKLLTPKVKRRWEASELEFSAESNPKPEYKKEEANFLCTFIVDVALKLQELQQITS